MCTCSSTSSHPYLLLRQEPPSGRQPMANCSRVQTKPICGEDWHNITAVVPLVSSRTEGLDKLCVSIIRYFNSYLARKRHSDSEPSISVSFQKLLGSPEIKFPQGVQTLNLELPWRQAIHSCGKHQPWPQKC